MVDMEIDLDDKKSSSLRQRMYHLTMYNISPIQQGIQSYHAGMEFALKYFNTGEFQQWAFKDKVVIILNGGTSNNIGYDVWNNECAGTMETHLASLSNAGIKNAPFYEPDLNNSLSAIAFLVDEMVWDKEKYPDPSYAEMYAQGDVPTREKTEELTFKFVEEKYGYPVAFLRQWLKQFRLA